MGMLRGINRGLMDQGRRNYAATGNGMNAGRGGNTQDARTRQLRRDEQTQRAKVAAENLTRDLSRLRLELAHQVAIAPSQEPDDASAATAPDEVIRDPDRPQSLDEVVGQETLKMQLETCLMGAMLRKERTPNILLQGSPGMGKTSIASLIATTIGADFVATSGPMMRRAQDLVGLIVKMTGPTILFLDEAHGCSNSCLEATYSILEDGKIDIISGTGADAVAYTQDCPHVIIVAGTTRPGLLPEPFRARCMTFTMSEYSDEEIATIIARSWDRHNVPYAETEPLELAYRSKSNPRRCVSLSQRVLDFAAVLGETAIHPGTVAQAMSVFKIEENGMDETDLRVIHALTTTFGGKSIGIEALSAYLNLDSRTLTDSIEPWLCREGYMIRSKSGRLATAKAHELAKDLA